MHKPLYQEIAVLLQARRNCEQTGNTEWFHKHSDRIDRLVRHMPSGSGVDTGTTLDIEKSTPNRLVFTCSYHHMNDVGYYDGWTEHSVIVTPSLSSGFDLRITGRDRNQIKDYLGELFQHALTIDVDNTGE